MDSLWNKITDVYRRDPDGCSYDIYKLFRSSKNQASVLLLLDVFGNKGFHYTDCRLAKVVSACRPPLSVSIPTCRKFHKQLNDGLVIPNWRQFCIGVNDVFNRERWPNNGEIPSYIPDLKTQNADLYAVSVESIDGQKFSCGDSNTPFAIQSICKSLNYSYVCEKMGLKKANEIVSNEGSGREYNLDLLPQGKPFNASCNAGAILISGHVLPHLEQSKRIEQITAFYNRLAGNAKLIVNDTMARNEYATGDRNRAIASLLSSHALFPKSETGSKATPDEVNQHLQLYMSTCSIMASTEDAATIASTLATGGFIARTQERVLKPATVVGTLTQMTQFGMYQSSGLFQQMIGAPGKSGVGGGIIVVVPNVMGISVLSPKLDLAGNSARDIRFMETLIRQFPQFHQYYMNYVSEERDVFGERLVYEYIGVEGEDKTEDECSSDGEEQLTDEESEFDGEEEGILGGVASALRSVARLVSSAVLAAAPKRQTKRTNRSKNRDILELVDGKYVCPDPKCAKNGKRREFDAKVTSAAVRHCKSQHKDKYYGE